MNNENLPHAHTTYKYVGNTKLTRNENLEEEAHPYQAVEKLMLNHIFLLQTSVICVTKHDQY